MAPRTLLIACCLWLLTGFVLVDAARAGVFSLEVGPKGLTSDRLELAQEPSFAKPLISSRIGQSSSYLVNFDKSGVYFYRLLRSGQEIERDQVVVVLEAPPPGQLIDVRWKSSLADASFRLLFTQPSGGKHSVVSSVPQAYFRANGVPWLLRVRAQRGSENQPIEALQMIYTKPPPAAVASSPAKKVVPVLQLDPFASDDDQLDAEPDYKELLKGPERRWWDLSGMLEGSSNRGSSDLKPLLRRHRLSLFLRSFQEDFAVNRRDRYASEKTQGLGTGFAAHYYLQPTFQLQFEGDFHATETIYPEGGSEPPANTQKRMRLLLGGLFDVLNLESRREDYSLDIGTNIALLQLPLRVDNQQLADFGFQVGLNYYPWGLQSTLRAFKSQSTEGSLSWTVPWLALNLGKKRIAPSLSVYQRRTVAKDGSTTSRFQESGLKLGLQLEL